MHSGPKRSALKTPFQWMGCASRQRKSPVGGFAYLMPYQALTPEGRVWPATSPLLVWMGARGESTCAERGDSARTTKAAPAKTYWIFIISHPDFRISVSGDVYLRKTK